MEILSHLNIPSPITQVQTAWSKKAGIELCMKRDDLIHPIISGNKWRKLAGVFAHYPKESFTQLTTYGGAYSNHLVATAAACAALGIRCAGIIRGEEPKVWNPVLKMCQLYGMNLQFVSRETYKKSNRTEGIVGDVLYVPEGGASKLGTKGCQDILNETDLSQIDKVFVSCGTGTTISGMYQSLTQVKNPPRLYGIQVLKGEGYIANDIEQDYGITGVTIYDEYHCGGYAKTNNELIEFVKEFARETGILLDPIYTGKMMLAIQKLCENESIKKGEKILAIHTGGLTGWFGKAAEL
ncbi:MAG TPA: 1-aminocyclopropane-1-carboxylate deaminase [Bacteroidetes bacterium]|nr:1-aminocyclopropane-1-carboxylate deaminase [Bacteroidota bacterium]